MPSESYARRIARAMSMGFSRSQARGHARKSIGEQPITQIKQTAKAENRSLKMVLREAVKRIIPSKRTMLKSGVIKTERRFAKSKTIHRTYTVHTYQQYRDVLAHHRGKAYAVQVNIYPKGEKNPYPVNPQYIRNRSSDDVIREVSSELNRFVVQYLTKFVRKEPEETRDPETQLLLSNEQIDHIDIIFISRS